MRRLRLSPPSLLPLLLLASGLRAQPGRSAMDRAVDAAAARGFTGVVVVGDAAGAAPRYERAVGVPAGATWRWASVTKQVTAALVLREVDAGRLALDDPLTRHLPDFAGPTGDRITVRMLLRHTSGLPNPEDGARDADGVPSFYRARGAPVGNGPAARGVCAGPPKRAPGERFEYDNCDYLVLGALLERVTGRDYATLVREAVARPLGLRSLRVAGAGARADGVSGTVGGVPEPRLDLATYGAAGALVGTPRDLLAFDRALLAHRLVSPARTDTMWTGDPAIGYAALGAWAFDAPLAGCAAPVRLVERRGAIGGVQVRNVIAPALGRALVVFANAGEGDLDFGEVWTGRGLTHDLLSAALCQGA